MGDPTKQTIPIVENFDAHELKKSVRLKKIWPQIEKCLSEGVKHKMILDWLNEADFDLTMASYKVMIKRIRGRKKVGEKDFEISRSQAPRTFSQAGAADSAEPKKFVHDVSKKINW